MSNWKDKFPKENRYFEADNGILYCANVLEILPKFLDESIDCIITSPPYWGLRDYQIEDQIGLESSLEEYLEKLFKVMRELKRILKKTGVIFWNHDDCYSGSGKGYGSIDPKYPSAKNTRNNIRPNRFKVKIPQKCLCLQNYRFILKCVDELGLILRNIIIWYKPNHMPSSVRDRFTNAYEPIFMLVKNKKYWFDLDAVRVPHKQVSIERAMRGVSSSHKYANLPDYGGGGGINKPRPNIKYLEKIGTVQHRESIEGIVAPLHPLGKNPGDLWEIPTQPFPESHFATFSEKLVEPMIKCACPQWICKKCGFIRERIIEKKLVVHKVFEDKRKAYQNVISGSKEMPAIPRARTGLEGHNEIYTIGWTDCGCNAGWESGIVLDPFMGSGTVAVVVERLGRRWIGKEINPEYCEIAKRRILKETRQLKLNFNQ